MLTLLATLAGCAQPDASEPFEPPDTAEPPDPCHWAAPEEIDLDAWDTIGVSGASAALFFDFALGPTPETLLWDDGVESTVTLTALPERIWETRYGPPESCLVTLSTSGNFGVVTDDGRLGATVPFLWAVEDARALQGIESLDVTDSVDAEAVAIAPLGTDSAFVLRVRLDTSGDIALALDERWAIDEHVTRSCERGSIGDVPGDCFEVDDRDGAD